MKQIHLFNSDEKLKLWGYGEWVEEPDLITFDYEGYSCVVSRIGANGLVFNKTLFNKFFKTEYVFQHFSGNFCGYVKILDNHSFYNALNKDDLISCHGGITFNEQCINDYWMGFDCGHSFDCIPAIEYFRKTHPEMIKLREIFPVPKGFEEFSLFNPEYRNVNFCIKECKSIVQQLQAYEIENNKEKSCKSVKA